MSFTVECVNTFDDFKKLESIWDDFLSKTPADNIFLTFDFLSTWWSVFGKGKQMLVLLVRDSGRLVGVAPLMIENNTIKFMRNVHSYYSDFVIIEKDKEVLLGILKYLDKHFNYNLVLEDIPADSKSLSLLKSCCDDAGFILLNGENRTSPIIQITTSWDKYYSTISRKFRKNVNYSFNGLSGRGKLVYSICTKEGQLDKMFEDMLHVELNSWKNYANRAITSDQEQPLFYKLLAEKMFDKKQLVLDLLYLNEKPISFHYSLKYKGMIYWLKTSFVEDYESQSPGIYLGKESFKHVFDSDEAKTIDCLGVYDEVKRHFANSEKIAEYVCLYKKNIMNIPYAYIKKHIWNKLGRYGAMQKIKNKLLGIRVEEKKNKKTFKRMQNGKPE